MPVLFCFGLGYSGVRLARRAEAAGFRVVGTSRQQHEGLSVLSFEDEEGIRRALAETTHLVSTVPPDKEGDDVVLSRYGDALGSIPWLGYCSSLSVYGDHGGACVDEETAPALPLSLRGERRLRAERAWQKLTEQDKTRLCLLRIAGIYGEGRNALLRLLLREREKTKGGVKEKAGGGSSPFVRSEGVFNRIHVEDLVSAVLSAAMMQASGIFNICDDLPARSHEPLLYAAELLGCAAPEFVSREQARARGLLSDMALSFHKEHKRVGNGKMKEELGVRLLYPDYRQGLKELWKRSSRSL